MNVTSHNLPDGRRMACRQFGNRYGRPILYCHGFPGSGLEAAFAEAAASAAGALILAPDRPGFGDSDPAAGRALTDWVDDATALLDDCSIDSVPVLAFSGGGPYALACCALRPERFQRVATFGALDHLVEPGDERGMNPLSRLLIHFARHHPRAQAAAFHLLAACIRISPYPVHRLLSLGECPADQALFHESRVRRLWIRSLRRSVAQGANGVIDELRLYVRDSGFLPGDVRCAVDLWHGLDDTVVPFFHGKRLAEQLPHARARFIPGEGHFSVSVRYIDDALRTLLDDEPNAE